MTITFDEDFTYTSGGLSFQLNCYSQDAANVLTTWQQYVIIETQGSNELTAAINNYSGTDSSYAQVINTVLSGPVFATLPGSNTIKAGYSLTIALNYDSAGNVAGATYSASDNGKVIGNTTVNILDQFLFGTITKATTADLAPIVAIVLNIGGMYNDAYATLTEGAGTIIYESTNPMIPMVEEPAFTVFGDSNNVETGENSNIIFGPLPDIADTLISQSFMASPGIPS